MRARKQVPMPVIPVVLSGGSGTRLWPLSRAARPKQFLRLGGEHSLFQDTILRCRTGLFDPRPIIVGAAGHRFLLADDLRGIGVAADIVLEPAPRDSCAAIAAGCLQALKRSADAVVLVLAADHHIPDRQAFAAAVARGLADAEDGHLLTFGIRPERPATSHGYILPGRRLRNAAAVTSFVEKPGPEAARRGVAAGYLWNSGNFLFRAEAFLRELERLEPALLAAVRAAHAAATADLGFLRLGDAFAEARSIAVDYAVMERTAAAAVLAVDYAWSDVGSWNAVAAILPRGPSGNAVVGDATVIGGRGNVVHSADRLTALIGVDDLVVVSTRDSLLVAAKSRAEEVKPLVARLQAAGRSDAVEGLQIFHPWGNDERLDFGDGYQVRRITVLPGGVLSLQKHRARHWVVVRGQAEVTIDGGVCMLLPGQSVVVPPGATHRLANRGSEPVVLIEVQTGGCLGEDGAARLDDIHDRHEGPAGAGE